MHLQATARIQSMQVLYKTIGCSYLLGDNHKFIADVRNKDHKITKMHHFVAFNIRMLQHLKVHSNVATFKGLFECRTFVYALANS